MVLSLSDGVARLGKWSKALQEIVNLSAKLDDEVT